MERRHPSLSRWLAWMGGGLALLPYQVEGQQGRSPDQQRIYGGDIAKPCEFPATLNAGQCSAFLVHPRVVLAARHCGNVSFVSLGESISRPAKRLPVKWCRITPSSGPDAQICVLEKAATGVPYAPIIQGCELDALKPGTPIYLAGFGYDEQDTDHEDNQDSTNNDTGVDTGDTAGDTTSDTTSDNTADQDTDTTSAGPEASPNEAGSSSGPGEQSDTTATYGFDAIGSSDQTRRPGDGHDEKRWVRTQLNRIADDRFFIGGNGKGGCNGDSGGPAYTQLSDGSWRVIGVTRGGHAHPDCDEGAYMRADVLLEWYQSQLDAQGETDIDLTPCFNDEGEWEPGPDCRGYPLDIQGPFGSWSNNCSVGVPRQGYSSTCGEPYGIFKKPKTEAGDTPTLVEPKAKPDPVHPVTPKAGNHPGDHPGNKPSNKGQSSPRPMPASGCSQSPAPPWAGALGLGLVALLRRRLRR